MPNVKLPTYLHKSYLLTSPCLMSYTVYRIVLHVLYVLLSFDAKSAYAED